ERAMVSALSKNKRGARCRARPFDPFFPAALGEGLCSMAGEHSGLVHQPADLVGPPDPGLVPGRESFQLALGQAGSSSYLYRLQRIRGGRREPTAPSALGTDRRDLLRYF